MPEPAAFVSGPVLSTGSRTGMKKHAAACDDPLRVSGDRRWLSLLNSSAVVSSARPGSFSWERGRRAAFEHDAASVRRGGMGVAPLDRVARDRLRPGAGIRRRVQAGARRMEARCAAAATGVDRAGDRASHRSRESSQRPACHGAWCSPRCAAAPPSCASCLPPA